SESANKITYDSLQIHGGTGYMKEFKVERLARDARITNIYEGTSQMQIVAASGGVLNDVLSDFFNEKEAKEYQGGLERLSGYLKEIRGIFKDALRFVLDKKDTQFQDIASKDLVELYGYIYIGYLILDEAEKEDKKLFIANRYILNSLANARKNYESIKNENFSDLLHADKILN
ncbi:MAG: acyl-CoA dehydrogenase family protein, partial [Methanococcaceae archaeon]